MIQREHVPLLKRGHNKDFALTYSEVEAVIKTAKSPITKAILILASSNYTVKEITAFFWNSVVIDQRLIHLREEYILCLTNYPHGFDLSAVAVWRRTKKALIKAAEQGVISLDPQRIPFPEALRFPKKDDFRVREQVISLAKRIHVLNGGAFDLRDPLTSCPHLDCAAARELLEAVEKEKKISR